MGEESTRGQHREGHEKQAEPKQAVSTRSPALSRKRQGDGHLRSAWGTYQKPCLQTSRQSLGRRGAELSDMRTIKCPCPGWVNIRKSTTVPLQEDNPVRNMG